MAEFKTEISSFTQEIDPVSAGRHKISESLRITESVRLGLTILSVLMGLTIVGTSANTLGVYNSTSVSGDYNLALWPSNFNIAPTVALVACSAIMVLCSATALAVSRVPNIPSKTIILSLTTISALVASLVATSYFYGVNASNSVSTLQSWSCQWQDLQMSQKPYWGPLCKESKTALYLTVIMIPLQVGILGAVTWGMIGQKKLAALYETTEGKASPALS